MPKRQRDFDKRRLGYVLGCLDKALEHALTLKLRFDEAAGVDGLAEDYEEQMTALAKTDSHAQFALLLHLAMQMTLMSQNAFEEFALHAYGGLPKRLASWRNTGQEWEAAQEQ